MKHVSIYYKDDFSEISDSFHCVHSGSGWDVESNSAFVVHIPSAKRGMYVAARNIRGFIRDLQHFYDNGKSDDTDASYEFVPSADVPSRHEDSIEDTPPESFGSAPCLICGDKVCIDDEFLSLTQRLGECIHRDCIPKFINLIRKEVNKSDVLLDNI